MGDIYYQPDSGILAVFYDDLDQSVPPPGLVRVGAVEGDVDAIAAAGNHVSLRIDLMDGTQVLMPRPTGRRPADG